MPSGELEVAAVVPIAPLAVAVAAFLMGVVPVVLVALVTPTVLSMALLTALRPPLALLTALRLRMVIFLTVLRHRLDPRMDPRHRSFTLCALPRSLKLKRMILR